MTIKDVIRGVKIKPEDVLNPRESIGYNSLAQAEVVVDRLIIAKTLLKEETGMMWQGICDEEKELWLAKADKLATAIESGSIISLKDRG